MRRVYILDFPMSPYLQALRGAAMKHASWDNLSAFDLLGYNQKDVFQIGDEIALYRKYLKQAGWL